MMIRPRGYPNWKALESFIELSSSRLQIQGAAESFSCANAHSHLERYSMYVGCRSVCFHDTHWTVSEIPKVSPPDVSEHIL
jgi:hypothetical protein